MGQKFPYTPTVAGLIKFLDQLRRSYPANLDAGLLKKLGIAPNNESYTINIAKFLRLFNEDGSRNPDQQRIFSVSDEEKFRASFSEIVKSAYASLFELHGDATWELDRGSLSTFSEHRMGRVL